MKWIGLVAAIGLIISCFIPWVSIENNRLILTGLDTNGTNFGKPGYFHLLLVTFFLICHFIPRVWAKRLNLIISAVNLGWAFRNFFVIAACSGGECPHKEIGLWLMLISSIMMLLSAMFPDMELPERKPV